MISINIVNVFLFFQTMHTTATTLKLYPHLRIIFYFSLVKKQYLVKFILKCQTTIHDLLMARTK